MFKFNCLKFFKLELFIDHLNVLDNFNSDLDLQGQTGRQTYKNFVLGFKSLTILNFTSQLELATDHLNVSDVFENW